MGLRAVMCVWLLGLGACLSTGGDGAGPGGLAGLAGPGASAAAGSGAAGAGGSANDGQVISFNGPSSAGTSTPGGGPVSTGSAGRPGGGAAPLDTGLPDDAELRNLTEAEAFQFCESLNDWQRESVGSDVLVGIACTSEGISASLYIDDSGNPQLDAALCAEARDDCIAAGNAPTDTVDCSEFDLGADTGGCAATVGDYEACARGLAQRGVLVPDAFTCDSFDLNLDTDALLADLAMRLDEAPECDALRQKCPELL